VQILRESLLGYPAEQVPLTEIVKLVDDAGAAADWHMAPAEP